MIGGTGLDETCPSGIFKLIQDHKELYLIDRNIHRGIILFVREKNPPRELTKVKFCKDVEGLFIEINLSRACYSGAGLATTDRLFKVLRTGSLVKAIF